MGDRPTPGPRFYTGLRNALLLSVPIWVGILLIVRWVW